MSSEVPTKERYGSENLECIKQRVVRVVWVFVYYIYIGSSRYSRSNDRDIERGVWVNIT